MSDIIDDLEQTAEYFRSDDGGDVIGVHACENAIKEIEALRAKIKRDQKKLQRIGELLGIPPGSHRLNWLLARAEELHRMEQSNDA